MVAAAVIGSAVVGGVATSMSSSNAAGAQTHAADQANATAQAQYAQTRSDLNPYNQVGTRAALGLNALTGMGESDALSSSLMQPFNMSQADLAKTPGYQFTLSQGLKAVQNSAAARGLGQSGAALRGAADYATGLADNTYQNQFNNYVTNQTNQYNRLMGLAQLGENSAAQTGAFGTQTAANIGNNLIGAGNAQGAAAMATGNAFSNGANSLGSLYLTNAFMKSNGGQGIF